MKTLRERIIEELKVLKAEPLMQKAPIAIEFVEDNYPEVVDHLSTEGMIAGFYSCWSSSTKKRITTLNR